MHAKASLSEAGISQYTHLLEGLRLLFRAGYVHRDVSSANILWVNGVGKLSDLEYCKTIEPPRPIVGDPAGGSNDSRNAVATTREHKTVSRRCLFSCMFNNFAPGNPGVHGLGSFSTEVFLWNR